MNAVDCFLICYLVPQISMFKELKLKLKIGSLQTTEIVKIVMSSGLHVDQRVKRLTVTLQTAGC